MSAALALILSAVAMTLIVGGRYLAASGGFALATRLRHPGLYAGLDAQMRREIWWSLATAAIYGVPAGLIARGWQNRGWTLLYTDLHASRPPTAWAAMAFHPIEALTGAVVIPLLVLAIPIHVAALGLVLAIMTVMGVTNHMGWEIFPAFMWRGQLGGWLITASHQQRHHERYGCNYGLYFRFWDRVCGTDGVIGGFAARHDSAARRTRDAGRGGDGAAGRRGADL